MSATSVRASGQCDNFPVLSHGGREQERTGLAAEVNFEIILRYLLRPRFHIPRQILFSLLAQQLGRAWWSFGSFGSRSKEYRRRKSALIGSFSKSASAKCTSRCQGPSTRLASEIHTTPPTPVRVQPRDCDQFVKKRDVRAAPREQLSAGNGSENGASPLFAFLVLTGSLPFKASDREFSVCPPLTAMERMCVRPLDFRPKGQTG